MRETANVKQFKLDLIKVSRVGSFGSCVFFQIFEPLAGFWNSFRVGKTNFPVYLIWYYNNPSSKPKVQILRCQTHVRFCRNQWRVRRLGN